MFTEKDIQNETHREITFIKGQALFQTGSVLDIDIEDDFENGFYINGIVEGSYGNEYDVWILVNKQTGKIDDYSCNCPAFFSYQGMCKHCVALALAYLEWQKTPTYLESLKGNFPAIYQEPDTDIEMLNIIEAFALRKRLKEQTACGNIELAPELHENYSPYYYRNDYSYFLTFKIGPEDGKNTF